MGVDDKDLASSASQQVLADRQRAVKEAQRRREEIRQGGIRRTEATVSTPVVHRQKRGVGTPRNWFPKGKVG
jgi:hypothetical protein